MPPIYALHVCWHGANSTRGRRKLNVGFGVSSPAPTASSHSIPQCHTNLRPASTWAYTCIQPCDKTCTTHRWKTLVDAVRVGPGARLYTMAVGKPRRPNPDAMLHRPSERVNVPNRCDPLRTLKMYNDFGNKFSNGKMWY